MASVVGVLMILLGLFVVGVFYGSVLDCQNRFSNSICWDPLLRGAGGGAFGFYVGSVIVGLGTIILVGPNVARLLGKWKSSGPTPNGEAAI